MRIWYISYWPLKKKENLHFVVCTVLVPGNSEEQTVMFLRESSLFNVENVKLETMRGDGPVSFNYGFIYIS